MLRQQNATVRPGTTAQSSTPGLPSVHDAGELDSAPQDHGRFRSKLKLRTSGYFYRVDVPLDEAAARAIFDRIQAKRSVTAVVGEPYFEGTPDAGERVALCVFEVRRPPAFAPTVQELLETRFGFCCLIEADGVLVVAHSGFSWTDALLPFEDPQTLTPHDARAVLGSIRTPRVDKIATRSMSISGQSIHARTLEADDLESSLPSLGARRHVVRSIRAVEDKTGASLQLVPGSSRLTQLGPRTELREFVAWIRGEMLRRLASRKGFPFLSRFAQPIRCDDLPNTVEPAGLSLALSLTAFAGLDWEFLNATGTARHIGAARMRPIFDRLRLLLGAPMPLTKRGKRFVARYPAPVGDVYLKENKESYSISNKFLSRLRFRDPDTGAPRALISALSENRSFLVTFTEIEYAFVAGQLVRTAHVAESLSTVLGSVEVHDGIKSATSEKGRLKGKIDPRSLFGVIERSCAKRDALLLLDDGGTEWADYIGLSQRGGVPVLSFYHAKHTGKQSRSASVLQVVIAQAEKNFGWLSATPALLAQREKSTWSKPYKWPRGGTIERVRRNRTRKTVVRALCEATVHPRAQRRVCVVVSSLTQTMLKRLARAGTVKLTPYETQLAWLLTVFVSSCSDAGVQPAIMCPR